MRHTSPFIPSRQLRAFAAVSALGGLTIDVTLISRHDALGLPLFSVGLVSGVVASVMAVRQKRRERFHEQHGTLQEFRARAHRFIDHERLFVYRGRQDRRGMIRYVRRCVPMPRRLAERFVDGLTDDDRSRAASHPAPASIPDERKELVRETHSAGSRWRAARLSGRAGRSAYFLFVLCIVGAYLTGFRDAHLSAVLMAAGTAVLAGQFWLVHHLETREQAARHYASYEDSLLYAREHLDRARLFLVGQKGPRAAARLLCRQMPCLPLEFAQRYVDGLTEADRPQPADLARWRTGNPPFPSAVNALRTRTGHELAAYGYTLLSGSLLLALALAWVQPPAAAALYLAGPVGALRLFRLAAERRCAEEFDRNYPCYEDFAARARNLVDHVLLFRLHDLWAGLEASARRRRRHMIRFLTGHVPGLPREFAERFLDGLTEADRPPGISEDHPLTRHAHRRRPAPRHHPSTIPSLHDAGHRPNSSTSPTSSSSYDA